MTRIGIYAGSFDPFTYGHLSVLEGALKVFDHVVIAIGTNAKKKTLFSPKTRESMIWEYLRAVDSARCSVKTFDGLLIDYARSCVPLPSIVRGLRAVSDFEAEMAIADVNRRQYKAIQTVFIPTEANDAFISSSAAKELAMHPGSDLSHYVNSSTAKSLRFRLGPQDEIDLL